MSTTKRQLCDHVSVVRKHLEYALTPSHASKVIESRVRFPSVSVQKAIDAHFTARCALARADNPCLQRVHARLEARDAAAGVPKRYVPSDYTAEREEQLAEARRIREETQAHASRVLRNLGPTPHPLFAGLRRMLNEQQHDRVRETMRLRRHTELKLPPDIHMMHPSIVNSNAQFELGITSINLHALACTLQITCYANNASFRSVDFRMIHMDGDQRHNVSARIYRSGTVVLIGMPPLSSKPTCALEIVRELRRHGYDCSVNNLRLNNLVLSFNLGSHLNIEAMAQDYAIQIRRLPMLPGYYYYAKNSRTLKALLFRTGCGIVPGVDTRETAIEFITEIYHAAQPYLYHDTDMVSETRDVAPGLTGDEGPRQWHAHIERVYSNIGADGESGALAAADVEFLNAIEGMARAGGDGECGDDNTQESGDVTVCSVSSDDSRHSDDSASGGESDSENDGYAAWGTPLSEVELMMNNLDDAFVAMEQAEGQSGTRDNNHSSDEEVEHSMLFQDSWDM